MGVINDLQPGHRSAANTDEEPTPPTNVPVLFLAGDDWLAGAPAASAQPNKLGWQSPSFTRLFEFDLSAVQRVRFSRAVAPGWRDHDYRLELAGGDVLYGDITGISADNLLFRSSLAGELRIKRSAVRCLERCKANPLVYLGPNGLGEWQASPDGWRDDEGALASDKDGAQIYRAIELPARALVEFEVSSLFPPVFRLSLGVGEGEAIRRDGFRLEVVDFDVIAVYETDNDIDVARVMTLAAGPERDTVHLRVLLDQHEQRADVFSAEGLPLASVQVKSEEPRVLPGVCLEHKRGGLRFERLRVWNWSGSLPKSLDVAKPQLHKIDGTVVDGMLAGYDAEHRRFMVSSGNGDVLCADDQVARIYFGQPEAPKERPLRVSCIDGTLLSGWFAGIDGERLSLDCASIDTRLLESPSLPLDALAGMAFSYPPGEEIQARGLVMWLDGGRTHGQLAPGRAEDGHSAVFWLPAGSAEAAPLRDDASAQIAAQSLARFGLTGVRHTTAVNSSARPPRQAEVKRPAAANAKAEQQDSVLRGRDNTGAAAATLYLTTGDTFRCQIIGIDRSGVRCRTASAEKQIPAANVKAVDLGGTEAAGSRGRRLDELTGRERTMRQANGGPAKTLANAEREKIARLLTLPRLSRDDPPTHVLCAVNGDYLRGRLLVMSESSLRFAVGDNEREFPRDRIDALIWLHPPADDGRPNASDGKPPETPDDSLAEAAADRSLAAQEPEKGVIDADAPPPNLAHAVCADGTRLTFVVTEIDGHVIAGVSDILGECQLPLDRLSELLLGKRVQQAASQTLYNDWALTPAPEPKAFMAGDQSAGASDDSPLVGKPAPDFELDLIDGGKFRLSHEHGRLVVLDFWASWCAPCVKGLPNVAQTVAAAPGGHVALVAINLRESAEQAKTALERMGVDATAVLDRDGAVAARYGATAIPHTVVIGPDGNVLRVLIGAGTETEKQLKAVLEPAQDEPR